jgi:hypothetical protein
MKTTLQILAVLTAIITLSNCTAYVDPGVTVSPSPTTTSTTTTQSTASPYYPSTSTTTRKTTTTY